MGMQALRFRYGDAPVTRSWQATAIEMKNKGGSTVGVGS